MKIYNTLTRKIEEFVPWHENKVGFYTCGPTVYHYAHIGNMRNYIGHDILDKTLRYLGYDVTRVMNITDVGHLTSDSDSGDDKMVKSAKEEHKTVMDIARFYTDAFFHDFELLNNRMPDIVSPATANINEYIKIIENLLEKGYAYQAGGNIYFDKSDPDTKLIRGIDDNTSLSDSDKKEIKNKWAKVYCDSKGSDANVEDYLKTEIKSYKAERYYRDPSVTTSTSDGRN